MMGTNGEPKGSYRRSHDQRVERGGKLSSENRGETNMTPSVGSNQCICARCGEGFSSVSAFDYHQLLNPRTGVECWEPSSIGMTKNKHGWWGRGGMPEGVIRERRDGR